MLNTKHDLKFAGNYTMVDMWGENDNSPVRHVYALLLVYKLVSVGNLF